MHESHFGLGFTSTSFLSAVLSNSSFVITSRNFSPSSLTLWYCCSRLFMEWCTLLPSSSLRYPNVLCLAKKQSTSKISSCIFREIFSSRKYFVKFPNPVHNDLTVFILFLSKIVLLKLTYRALSKYRNIQIYARETLVHQKLHHVVSHNYLI